MKLKSKLFVLFGFSSLIFSFLGVLNFSSKNSDSIPIERFIKAMPMYTPTDSKFNQQKQVALNYVANSGDLETAWDYATGKNTTICIIDSGIDANHPDFEGKILPESASFSLYQVNGNVYYDSSTYCGYKMDIVKYSEDPTCLAHEYDSEYAEWNDHGSNVAGTAAAKFGGGNTVGIAPDAKLLICKVDFYLDSIMEAIHYATEYGVDVINMSLGAYATNFTDGHGDAQVGSASTATTLQQVINEAYNAGIIVIAAAGNEATDYPSYPACNNHVIGVGALDEGSTSSLAYFTNYNGENNTTGENNVDILAPGYVYASAYTGSSSNGSSSYKDTQGTSFSSPIVAGAAALWKELNPNGTPDEFENALTTSAYDIGAYVNKKVYSQASNITCGRLDLESLIVPSADVKLTDIEVSCE